MNIMNKLTIQNLKKNKKRTVVTVIGIILSTALICAVAGMCMSFKKSMIDFTIAENGNYHVCYQNVPQQELKYIEKNVNVENFFYSKDVGTAKLENSQNEYKPYLNIIAMDDVALQNNGFMLIEGRMPQNNNEIIVQNTIETNGRVSYKVGETINLEVGTRAALDGTILTQKDSYLLEDYSESGSNMPSRANDEKIINTTSKQYTIVGIIERVNSVIEPYDAPGYTVVTKLMDDEINQENSNYNIYVRAKNPKEFNKVHKNICETLKSNTGNDIKYFLNTQLLQYEGDLSEEAMSVIYGLAAIVIGIIIVSSVFVIRNSFSISVTEKVREFGMLSSIGATSKQIRKSVIFEGFIIALIGIPIGIISGVIAVVVLVEVINALLMDEFVRLGAKFTYSIPLIVPVLSVILGWVTIFCSSLVPAIKASKISAIEAIRSNNDIKIKNKKLRTSKLTKKLFGIGGVIASKSLKRSKKKYRTTVISLVVSIVIFISLSAFINYGFKSFEIMYTDVKYNVCVYAENQNQVDEIVTNSLVKDYSAYKSASFDINLDNYGTEFSKGIMGTHEVDGITQNTVGTTVIFVNRAYFNKYLEENHIDTKKANEVAILSDTYVHHDGKGKKTVGNVYNIKPGDAITGIAYGKNENNETITIKITNRAEKDFRGYELFENLGGAIFVSEDYYQKDKFEQMNDMYLYIVTDKADELEKQLIDLKNKDDKFKTIHVNNIDKESKQFHRIVILVSIFLYGFIIVITLIGVTNVFNTITTNMILRSKEFAMLKSIGMTRKEFNRMIRLESFMYGFKSLLIGVPIGTLASYGIYKVLANEIDFGFSLPIKAILICVVFIFIIVSITMKYSMQQINKQNIVETIRNDNIWNFGDENFGDGAKNFLLRPQNFML